MLKALLCLTSPALSTVLCPKELWSEALILQTHTTCWTVSRWTVLTEVKQHKIKSDIKFGDSKLALAGPAQNQSPVCLEFAEQSLGFFYLNDHHREKKSTGKHIYTTWAPKALLTAPEMIPADTQLVNNKLKLHLFIASHISHTFQTYVIPMTTGKNISDF